METKFMAKTNLFRHATKTVSFKAGTTIFNEGDIGEEMYVIVSGVVELPLHGHRIIDITEGEVFGEMALLEEGHSRTATAIAKTDLVLANIGRERFIFLVHESPFFALDVMRTLSERLHAANNSIPD